MKTDVIFKIHQGEVFAAFPAECGNYDPRTMSSYAHTGQHSAACESFVALARPATPEQYQDLMRELVENVGYENLRIVRRCTRKHYEQRKAQLNSLRVIGDALATTI